MTSLERVLEPSDPVMTTMLAVVSVVPVALLCESVFGVVAAVELVRVIACCLLTVRAIKRGAI